eukprot:14675181-Alexandrium_andersonii.AAC.1
MCIRDRAFSSPRPPSASPSRWRTRARARWPRAGAARASWWRRRAARGLAPPAVPARVGRVLRVG